MITFLVTILQFFRAIIKGLKDPEFRAILITAFIVILIGTLFYMKVEKWSLIDSVYFCVITLTTVGYGDLFPTTPISRIFTVAYILIGIGILLAFIDKIVRNVGPQNELFKKRLQPNEQVAGQDGQSKTEVNP